VNRDHDSKIPGRIQKFLRSIKSRISSIIFSDPLFKGIVILGSGTIISQILGLIFIPVLTRIYPPEIYGTLAVFSSLLSLLIIGSSLRYDLTIQLVEMDEDAEYLFILSLVIISILTIILFIILIFLGNYFAVMFHFEFIAPYYWLFCVGFFGISLYNILTDWTLRTKEYVRISHTRIAQSITASVSKIIFGILSFGSLGLICGEILGRMAGIGTLGRPILPRIWVKINKIDLHKLRSLGHKFRAFPAFSLPSSFINEISLQVPILFISGMFGFQIVGLYSLSYSVLVLPVSFVSGSVAMAYIAESAELFRQKSTETLALYLKTTKKLFSFSAPVILLGAIISPVLFPVIFGSAWKDAGMFVLPLSLMVIAQFVVSSTDRLELYGYNHWELGYNIIRTFLVLSGFYLSSLFRLSPVATVLVYSLIMTSMYIVNYSLNIKAIVRGLHKNDAVNGAEGNRH
jgi:O-antigen/teichoic acid export membrane protein